jgi:putative endonuclease
MEKISVGKKGEEVASLYLQENGYKILERNYKNKYSEIDIIAEKDGFLHFVEVRSTATTLFGTPEETVREKKKRKMESNALAYTTFHNYKKHYQIDLICVFFLSTGEVEKINFYENIIN